MRSCRPLLCFYRFASASRKFTTASSHVCPSSIRTGAAAPTIRTGWTGFTGYSDINRCLTCSHGPTAHHHLPLVNGHEKRPTPQTVVMSVGEDGGRDITLTAGHLVRLVTPIQIQGSQTQEATDWCGVPDGCSLGTPTKRTGQSEPLTVPVSSLSVSTFAVFRTTR
jgi:hypothetical protein